MIELAPNWKRNLTIANPILLAAGGYTTDAVSIGAFATLPTTLRPRAGAPLPRVGEIPGGILMRIGAANPGLSHILREYRRAWEQIKIPIVVAFASQGVNDWAAMARQLDSCASGIELQFNSTMDVQDAIRVVRSISELPILAKLDLENARAVAADCVQAGANALVIGRAPRGMKMIEGKEWFGRLHGPAAKPLALKTLAEIRDTGLEIPLIGCGGIHSVEDAREFLAAGARAVEIDSAEWIEPGITERIATELGGTRTNVDETL